MTSFYQHLKNTSTSTDIDLVSLVESSSLEELSLDAAVALLRFAQSQNEAHNNNGNDVTSLQQCVLNNVISGKAVLDLMQPGGEDAIQARYTPHNTPPLSIT